MGKKNIKKNEGLEELRREHKLLDALSLSRPTNYRMAEKIWNEALRNANTGEVVTSWAGVVS